MSAGHFGAGQSGADLTLRGFSYPNNEPRLNSNMKTLLISATAAIMLLCPLVDSQAQSSVRAILTWDDFTSASADSIGMNSHLVVGVTQALVMGENNTRRDLWSVEVDKESSKYDPSKVTDWDLRYNQVLYDMALLAMKQALKDNHNGLVGIYGVYSRYRQLYDTDKEKYLIISAGGRDTSAIMEYENKYKDQVAEIKYDDFYSVEFSFAGRDFVDIYPALMIGYENNMFLTGLSENFDSWNGFYISAELHFKSRFRVEAQFSRLWSNLKTKDFYYDPITEYNWTVNNKTHEMIIRFGAGYEVLSKDRISLVTFAGLQSPEIYQKTGFKDLQRQEVRSSIPDGDGVGVYMGMDIDYRPTGTFGVRLKVFGSYGAFDKTYKTWSLNTGISLLLPKYL